MWSSEASALLRSGLHVFHMDQTLIHSFPFYSRLLLCCHGSDHDSCFSISNRIGFKLRSILLIHIRKCIKFWDLYRTPAATFVREEMRRSEVTKLVPTLYYYEVIKSRRSKWDGCPFQGALESVLEGHYSWIKHLITCLASSELRVIWNSVIFLWLQILIFTPWPWPDRISLRFL